MIPFEAFFSIGESCRTLFAENRVFPTSCQRERVHPEGVAYAGIWQKLLCFQCDGVFLQKTEGLPVATPLRENGV